MPAGFAGGEKERARALLAVRPNNALAFEERKQAVFLIPMR